MDIDPPPPSAPVHTRYRKVKKATGTRGAKLSRDLPMDTDAASVGASMGIEMQVEEWSVDVSGFPSTTTAQQVMPYFATFGTVTALSKVSGTTTTTGAGLTWRQPSLQSPITPTFRVSYPSLASAASLLASPLVFPFSNSNSAAARTSVVPGQLVLDACFVPPPYSGANADKDEGKKGRVLIAGPVPVWYDDQLVFPAPKPDAKARAKERRRKAAGGAQPGEVEDSDSDAGDPHAMELRRKVRAIAAGKRAAGTKTVSVRGIGGDVDPREWSLRCEEIRKGVEASVSTFAPISHLTMPPISTILSTSPYPLPHHSLPTHITVAVHLRHASAHQLGPILAHEYGIGVVEMKVQTYIGKAGTLSVPVRPGVGWEEKAFVAVRDTMAANEAKVGTNDAVVQLDGTTKGVATVKAVDADVADKVKQVRSRRQNGKRKHRAKVMAAPTSTSTGTSKGEEKTTLVKDSGRKRRKVRDGGVARLFDEVLTLGGARGGGDGGSDGEGDGEGSRKRKIPKRA